MSFFRVIIPCYNGGKRMAPMIESIKAQSCQDYHLIIVDDQSTDDSLEVVQEYSPDKVISMDHKGYAAGARNEGMKHYKSDKYTLWLDDDDVLIDNDAFKKLKQCAIDNDYPDIIRFNWIATRLSTGMRGNHHDRFPSVETPKSICQEIYGGMPWSKAVKTSKCVEFPECLAIDDCYQHIMQCDVCETAAVIHDDLYEWLVRTDSLTTAGINVFRDSGWYLEIAMLMRQKEHYIHDYARAAADMRIAYIKRKYLGRM